MREHINREAKRKQLKQLAKLNSETVRMCFKVPPEYIEKYGMIFQGQVKFKESESLELCKFLVDTGSINSSFKKSFLKERIPEKIIFVSKSALIAGAVHQLTHTLSNYDSESEDNAMIDGRVGRDWLTHVKLTYDGKSGQIVFIWHKQTPKA